MVSRCTWPITYPNQNIERCAREGMCDVLLDALTCIQSAISRGFHTDALRSFAQLYIDHGFSV